jgi:hypothetical protein
MWNMVEGSLVPRPKQKGRNNSRCPAPESHFPTVPNLCHMSATLSSYFYRFG